MTDKTQNAMWGGRFAAGPDAIMEAINASIGFDRRLYAQDIAGSRAHAAMLAAQGIISDKDAKAIREGLLTVLSEIETGNFAFSTALEDIHMNVEARLKEIIGEPAGRLHTARSAATIRLRPISRLWVRDQTDANAIAGCRRCRTPFLAQAEAGADLGHARIHPSADRAAGDLGPPHAGLCGDVLGRDVSRLRRCPCG